jgi:hypothetical protein
VVKKREQIITQNSMWQFAFISISSFENAESVLIPVDLKYKAT